MHPATRVQCFTQLFRCCLPVDMVDVEVRIASMQGTHMFRKYRTCQVIKCNPWSIRLCPHPTIIKKMKTYFELEGKLGPKPQPQFKQFRPLQPDTNPHIRKKSKATKKRKRLIPTKKYKVKVVARPNSNNTTVPPPQANLKAPVHSEGQKPLPENTPENNPPPLEDAPVCPSTPWLKAGKMSGNLFELRKDWPILPTNNVITATNSKPSIKVEPQGQEPLTPSVTALLKEEQRGWGPNCPICKNAKED